MAAATNGKVWPITPSDLTATTAGLALAAPACRCDSRARVLSLFQSCHRILMSHATPLSNHAQLSPRCCLQPTPHLSTVHHGLHGVSPHCACHANGLCRTHPNAATTSLNNALMTLLAPNSSPDAPPGPCRPLLLPGHPLHLRHLRHAGRLPPVFRRRERQMPAGCSPIIFSHSTISFGHYHNPCNRLHFPAQMPPPPTSPQTVTFLFPTGCTGSSGCTSSIMCDPQLPPKRPQPRFLIPLSQVRPRRHCRQHPSQRHRLRPRLRLVPRSACNFACCVLEASLAFPLQICVRYFKWIKRKRHSTSPINLPTATQYNDK